MSLQASHLFLLAILGQALPGTQGRGGATQEHENISVGTPTLQSHTGGDTHMDSPTAVHMLVAPPSTTSYN